MWPFNLRLNPNRRHWLLMALLLIALYVLLPQFSAFRSSWHLIRHPDVRWAAAAVGLTALTYLAAAANYCFLALKPLGYGQTAIVQLAAMLINRLLPAGIGALGVNYAYLRRMQHSPTQAAGIVAINNLLGILGHGLLAVIGLAILPGSMAAVATGHGSSLNLLIKLILAAPVLLVVLALFFGRQRLNQAAITVRAQLLSYRRRPSRVMAALMSSMILTLCNIGCLLCCDLALGVHLPFIVVLLIFSFGLGTGAATPTPGGLGGFEAGLTAGLIAYHVASPTALAVALLYRLVSYWLPLPFGVPALIACQRRRLLPD